MRALLDVNVLIALLDAGHIHHELAQSWLESNIEPGWASCPLTQNGCIRILSQPNYPAPLPAAQVAERLAEAAATSHHEFWVADVNLLDGTSFDWKQVLGHRQVTDLYLLALAVRHDGRFVTFDRRINFGAVSGAQAKHLHVIG
ncbi:MAG: VapC toxin family PIN domain ribonuclease [Gallionellales bacterium CG_4_9_14_0_8_um_filter_59_50]|nr:MAG: VapC toxin family PIN domain ribonuclease [Gallionellales bacterium CG_4_9_14_0_8_um_filter_59_50]